MITIWGRKSSSNVQSVMWCLEELQLRYKRIDAGLTYGVTNTPEYLLMNPNGRVPTIRDDHGDNDNPPVWESAAILRYLANKYASGEFWPAKPEARAVVDQWAEWSKINASALFTHPIFWKVVRTPKHLQDPASIETAVKNFEAALQIAGQQLQKNEYLAGPAFTLADIQFGHVLYRYYDISIKRNPHPAVTDYYERISSRPAYQQHVAVSYDELRA